MYKKKVFNEFGVRGTQRIINGNTTNLREWIRIKYDWARVLYRTMLTTFGFQKRLL